jgi:hypothetical protein
LIEAGGTALLLPRISGGLLNQLISIGRRADATPRRAQFHLLEVHP